MKRLAYIFLFCVAWYTWFELCQGYGVRVLPKWFELLYWVNMGILFLTSISLILDIRVGVALTPLVMILEDVTVTTIHRAFESGPWYALIHWNLENHP